jgi:PAS domain S-box-containing protein
MTSSVVIVDDRVTNRAIYARLTTSIQPDLVVYPFDDPHTALEWLTHNEADLVITDYKMPQMHGSEFTRCIRQLPVGADVPVIVITAYSDRGYRIDALEAGATDFLLSPVDHYEFKTRVKNLLKLSFQQRLIRDRAVALEQELRQTEISSDRLLRDSREQLAQVIDTVPAMIRASDRDGRCIFCNAFQASFVGVNPACCIPASDRPGDQRCEHNRHLDRLVLAAGKPLPSFEEDLTDQAGAPHTFETTKSPLRNATGEVVGVVTTCQDITGRRRTEAALRQAQKMEAVGNVAGGMAHDFNNLLSVAIGNLDLIVPMVEADTELSELVDEILDAMLRGADLTQRLLAFGRRQPLQPVALDVNEVVSGMVRLLGRVLGQTVQTSLHLAGEVWTVAADRAQLEAAIANLATNARDAMPKGGALHIATANSHIDADQAALQPDLRPGDYVMIEVTDSGTGMAPEVMAQIFEPFFTTKAVGKGTGLGLSMVFGFARQSGGHISVRSELRSGSTFRLLLPRATDVVQAAPAHTPAPATPVGRGETVLVVEDNPELRRLVTRLLAEFGYSVLETDGARAALQILESTPVHLLFTDIVMSGDMDGFELARQSRGRWPGMRVLLTSGFAEASGSGQIESRDPPVAMLRKPYRKEQLAQAVHDALVGRTGEVSA